ncbi:MAG: tetraacyldisaccharide 4'-kinase [Gammaproteobacteria bacterium]|nr:tetraacyldisaccharide 4'-kinase [Gammaproteobacteria bacterium]
MKTPSFWQSPSDPRSLLLAPLGWLWCRLARRRLLAYRKGEKHAERLPVPVIVVGNITVGGSGKTPLTLWLAQTLHAAGWRPAVLSRGYGAKIEGEPRRVRADSLATEVGDEPLLLKRRLGETVELIVHPERVRAGRLAIALGANVLLLDDGLQHLKLARDLEIAVVDGARGLGNGRCLPAGPLREPLERLQEVDAVVVQGGASEAGPWGMRLIPRAAVNLVDGRSQPLAAFRGQPCDALAGIAHPERFFAMLRGLGLDIEGHPFADHHPFSAADLAAFAARPLLMTEKDAVKCQAYAQPNHWYVPVEAEVDAGLAEFILSRLEPLRDGQTPA